MAYFLENISDRYARSRLNESRLLEDTRIIHLMGDQIEPRIAAEAYELNNGQTLYVAESLVGRGAQDVADIVQAPLGELMDWRHVQRGLKRIAHQRRAIAGSMSRAGKRGHLHALKKDAFNLSHSMELARGERTIKVNADVVSFERAEEVVDTYLRDISSEELRKIMAQTLGVDIDSRRFRNWVKAHRKNPKHTDTIDAFFENLRNEMEREGYKLDDNTDVFDNLEPDEVSDLKLALWERLFRAFDFYYDESHDNFPPPDIPYVRAGNVPSTVPDDSKSKLQMSAVAQQEFVEKGTFSGQVTFHFPAVGYVVRPTLIWTKDADGERRLRFDTQAFQFDPDREQVYYCSPILGAAAISAAFGDFTAYHRALSAINPYVRTPKVTCQQIANGRERWTARDRAGLWPLVSDSRVLNNPYVRSIESALR